MPLRVIDLGPASAIGAQATAYGIADALLPGGEAAVVLADPVEPSLSVGANQDVERDIDRSFYCERGIPIIRRRLGGGAIYIDRDQLMFHLIMPLERAPRPTSRMMTTLAAAPVDACRDFGIAAELRPPGDIAVRGGKLGGTAGVEIDGSVVVGGTLLFDFDAATMARCLKLRSDKYRIRLARLLLRGLTTMRRGLGAPPCRAMVKRRLVANLACHLGAESEKTELSEAERAAIVMAGAQLADAALRG